MPFLPARIFNFCKRFPEDNFLPLTVTGSPFLNPIVTKEALLGAFSAEFVLWKINSGGEFFGFSKTFPSVDVWNKLSSTENGADPLLSLGTGILFFLRI